MTPLPRWDWLQFVKQHHIQHVTQGRNVSAGHIAIKCPFCGQADPSEHMVLSLKPTKPYWSCWRNVQHRGAHPAYLVAKLLSISTASAREMMGMDAAPFQTDWDNTLEKIKQWASPAIKKVKKIVEAIDMPRSIYPLDGGPSATPFYNYIKERKFDTPKRVARDFRLHYAITGRFAYRIVFPIYWYGKLVNIVARDITGRQEKRYLMLGKDQSSLAVDEIVYNADEMREGGRALWLTEGPFDAIKLSTYAPSKHVAVAFFGMPKAKQVALVAKYARDFERSLIALDANTTVAKLRLQAELPCGATCVWLSEKDKDLGNLSPGRVRKLVDAQERLLTS
jgi:hypothetical protein